MNSYTNPRYSLKLPLPISRKKKSATFNLMKAARVQGYDAATMNVTANMSVAE